MILLGIADRMVPADQVEALRRGIETFLTASQLTLVDMGQATATFKRSQAIAATLPEPSAHLMRYVNERNTKALGAELLPVLERIDAYPPALSAERSPAPAAPVYLLHGTDDTVIPAVETRLLARIAASARRRRAPAAQRAHHARGGGQGRRGRRDVGADQILDGTTRGVTRRSPAFSNAAR